MFRTIRHIGEELQRTALNLMDDFFDGLDTMTQDPLAGAEFHRKMDERVENGVVRYSKRNLDLVDWYQALDRTQMFCSTFQDQVELLDVISRDEELSLAADVAAAHLEDLKLQIENRIAEFRKNPDAFNGEEISTGKAETD